MIHSVLPNKQRVIHSVLPNKQTVIHSVLPADVLSHTLTLVFQHHATAIRYSVNTSGNCTEQLPQIQSCVNAGAASKGSMAYLPGGNYHICAPIKVPSGSDFWFSGAGYATNILLHPGGKQQQAVETDGGSVEAVKETGKDGGGPSWVPPPSPTTMAHIGMDAAGSIGARVSDMFFSGNNWKDPLTNITHDVCSVRVSKAVFDTRTEQTS